MTSNELEIFKQSILDDVRVMMQTTGQVTQYIGARYVPLFADPLDWSDTKEYEPLTIVLHQGNSFTSRQFVPKGINISDESFWANTGNYNAQIEQYRQEVAAFDGRIVSNTNKIETVNSVAQNALSTATAAKAVTDKNIIVVFGDSWTANRKGENTALIATFSNNVKKSGMIVKNYGESGAGFVNLSLFTKKTLKDEINEFVNDSSYDKARVKAVLIIGGCNDIYHNRSGLTEAVQATFDALESAVSAPYFYLPNVTTPGCLWNYAAATNFINSEIRVASSWPYINMFLFHCQGGIFQDSRHLTTKAQYTLGKILANKFTGVDNTTFYFRHWGYMGLLDGIVSGDAFSPDSDIIIDCSIDTSSTKITTFKDSSPFVEPSSDSPEYTNGVPSLGFRALCFHTDGTNEYLLAKIKAPNELVLSQPPQKTVFRVVLTAILPSILTVKK